MILRYAFNSIISIVGLIIAVHYGVTVIRRRRDGVAAGPAVSSGVRDASEPPAPLIKVHFLRPPFLHLYSVASLPRARVSTGKAQAKARAKEQPLLLTVELRNNARDTGTSQTMGILTLEATERDEAGNLTATYIESQTPSVADQDASSRVDIIVCPSPCFPLPIIQPVTHL